MRLVLIATACLLPLVAAAQTAPAPTPAAVVAPVKKPSDAARKAALALNEKLQFVGQINLLLASKRYQLIVGLAHANNKKPEQVQPAVDELLMPDFTAHANEIASIIVDLWATAFTAEELNGIVEFYNGPLGQKMLKTMPVLSQDVNTQGQAWVQAVQAESLKKHAAALAERGIKIPTEGASRSGP